MARLFYLPRLGKPPRGVWSHSGFPHDLGTRHPHV